MPAPPNITNLNTGGMIASIGGIDLGNIVSASIDASDIEILEHFTARSGARQLDKQVVTEKKLTFTFELDEHAAETYRLYTQGGNAGLIVDALTLPLVDRNCSVTWRNEAGTLWTYSHTRVNLVASDEIDFGEWDDWPTMEVEMRVLFDSAQAGREMGRFTFTA